MAASRRSRAMSRPQRPRDTKFRPLVVMNWKRLKGKNPEGKNFQKLLRTKQSSAKISKISRNTLKTSKSDIFYLLRNLLKYLLRTFFSSAKFSEVFALCVFTLWLFLNERSKSCMPPRLHWAYLRFWVATFERCQVIRHWRNARSCSWPFAQFC